MQWDLYFILWLFHFYVSINSDSCACGVMKMFMLKLYWKVYFQCDMTLKPWNWYCARLWGVVSTRAMGSCQHQGYGELSVTGLWGVVSTGAMGSCWYQGYGELSVPGLWRVVSNRAMGSCQHWGYGELLAPRLWGVDSKWATAERGSLYITLCGQLNIYTSGQNSR